MATTTTLNTDKSPEQPRRNLTEAFEALCSTVVSPEETAKEEKNDVFEASSIVSPTGVTDLAVLTEFPDLQLHKDLARDLSPECIMRVSCYSIIHDINKEAAALAAHDPLHSDAEKSCPLVLSAQGKPVSTVTLDPTLIEQAIIDEEKWLLSAINHVEPTKTTVAQCPPTFLQAMGEKEYDNTAHSVDGRSRTQLWKPSRSWWEAKSGKNPWIEPASHNKRWRYLWPLIHYHKFLAKCIKKLKRNGVDVKVSSNPVSVFLREEVCSISDHLAEVSFFGSDQWMDCLQHFSGWTLLTSGAVRQYRDFITSLALRNLDEPGDVDSPVLRNQIDEAFLRTMSFHRQQLQTVDTAVTSNSDKKMNASSTVTAPPPPTYPSPVPRQIKGVRRPRYYQNGWYGWEYHDSSSVQSELSTNSFQQYPYYYCDNSQSSGYNTYDNHYGWYYYPPNSPEEEGYWSHLDQATLAMGLATPAKVHTPRRVESSEGYGNPYNFQGQSPATQFMNGGYFSSSRRRKSSPKHTAL